MINTWSYFYCDNVAHLSFFGSVTLRCTHLGCLLKILFVSMSKLSARSFFITKYWRCDFLKSPSNVFFLFLYGLSTAFYVSAYSILAPWSRVFLEKLTGSQLVKKFLAFYGTRRLITAIKNPANCPIYIKF
jgi:hypothetical protein